MNHRFLSGSLGRILLLSSTALVVVCGLTLLRHSSQVKASSTLGQPIPNLTALENTLFTTGQGVFAKVWSLAGGLGPVFTQANCATCHASPVDGGGAGSNKLRMDELFGGTNADGSFNPLTDEGGPLLQQRSVSEFKPTCTLPGETVPSDATITDKRLAPQAFGMGLIDSIPDSAIMAEAASQQANMPFGIVGQPNLEPDENGVTRPGRFGYKAEAVTLVQFVSFAMLNEVGISNPVTYTSGGVTIDDSMEVCPQGNCNIPQTCLGGLSEPDNDAPPANALGANLIANYHYLLYLAPNPFPILNSNQQEGENLFNSIGCSTCHLPQYTTGPKIEVWETWPEGSEVIFSKALSNQQVNLYSDLLIHNMGGLVDGFPSLPLGTATGSDFRTTPLWGLSTRSIYLHDGRTTKLATAVLDHDLGTGSEAHQVIENYKALSPTEQSDILQFIGAL
jgi:CxxC motif-containing protein (DUF1111 family)